MSMRPDFDWLDFPSVIAVMGEKGGGKSATAHEILESRFHNEGIECYFTPPTRDKKKEKCLPKWLHVVGRKIPPNSATLISDAQVTLSKDEYHGHFRAFNEIASLSRHRDATIIMEAQLVALLEKGARQQIDVKVFKRPPLDADQEELQSMRKFIILLNERFDELEKEKPEEDIRTYSFVISRKPRYQGFVGPTGLPSYWSEELSKW